MANLRTDNLCGEGGRNAIRGSVVFGGGDNSAAGLTIADNSELELSSETHWTIEFWIWLNGAVHGDYDVVLGKGSASGNNYEYFVEVMSDNTLEFLTTSTGSAWTFQQQISPVLSHDSWHHVAVVRNGSGSNSLKSYINGQEYGSFTAQSIHTSAYPFGIGYFAGGNNLYSKITLSNLRICKGHAVYTANFTPPFYELKSHYIDGDDKTVLLCCQDSDNPLQEATGKTITGVGHLANGAVIHPKNVPPYGVDAGNTFNGAISMNTSAYMNFPTGRTEERFPDFEAVPAASARGLFGGGAQPFDTKLNLIEFITISTTGNTQDFGDLTVARGSHFGCSSNVRGVFAGGASPSSDNIIDFVTISTTGDAADFGDLTTAARNGSGASNSTRGVFALGNAPTYSNLIDFITISTGGNGLKFGDLTQSRDQGGSCASTTRGLFAGGLITPTPATNLTNIIDFVTISTTANAIDFGDLLQGGSNGIRRCGGLSNSTRGLFAGGESTGSTTNIISFVTIATTGDAQDFGDLSAAVTQADNGASSSVRGVFHLTAPANTTLHYVTINTAGNSTDFGDMTSASTVAGMSNGHGGLG